LYLKRAEMVGFKTFADRIDMEFGRGITAIVGPNGSGKSNITDALRFCLGEASSRTLRGNRMEEMIFAGSGQRGPSSVGEVTITFDNQDGYFPLEFSEVSITRRLYRGGDNQYFINKSPCRLKDIQQLMAGTGLGHGSICMLGQREMQMVLSPDTQDRKLILEEAAGIMKYKLRKREASRKLDQVKENLTRLHDILREVKSGLSQAESQLERYRRYKKFEERLRRLEVALAAQEMDSLQQSLQDVLSRGSAAATRAQETGERLGSLEETVRVRREEMARLEEELQAAQEQRRQASIELERARNEVSLCDEREKNLEKDRERILARLQRIQEMDAELASALEKARQEAEAAAREVARRDEDVRLQEQALADLDARSIDKTPGYRQALDEQNAVAQERAGISARIQASDERAARAMQRAEGLDAQATRVETDGSEHSSRHQEKAAEAAALKSEIIAIEATVNTLRARRAELEASLESTARDFEKIEDEYHQKSSRLGALMEIEGDYQGFSEGVRFLLNRPHKPSGVIGVVSECVVPDRPHAKAIEAALGGHAQDVLVEEKRHAKLCIEFLKKERGGKVTFWPLDLERPPQRRPDVLGDTGVVGWAPDLVRFEPRFESVVHQMLGRTVVVETLDDATRIYEGCVRRRAFIPMLVTLDGDILAPGGSMSGGAHKNSKAGPVQRRAELEALEKDVESLRKKFIRIKEERRKNDEELRVIRAQVEELRNQVQRDQHHLGEIERTASVAQSRAESVASEVARLRNEAEEALKEAGAAEDERAGLQVQLEGLTERDAVVAELLTKFAAEREEHLRERDGLAQVLDGLREARGEAMRIESEAAQRVRFHAERRAELQEEGRELDGELSGAGGVGGRLERDRETAAADLKHFEELDRALGERCEGLSRTRAELAVSLERMEVEMKEVSMSYELDRTELHACEVERATLSQSFEEHRLRLEELEVGREELLAARNEPIDRENVHAEITRTRNYLKNFGNVNLGAAEDYETLKTRYDEMTGQIGDLEEASASLLGVMKEMDDASVKQFAECFGRVKKFFAENFEELFRGGQARLELTDPDNLLETGVDITAQPPGKRQQNLALLSSGEKALTAIAFLLAILKARPSPFVVLDELDAPLDDTNVERVARKFLEYSEDTQFITITHNRKTMEYARVLYGVTMAEPGVSRLVAVSLEEANRELHPMQPVA